MRTGSLKEDINGPKKSASCVFSGDFLEDDVNEDEEERALDALPHFSSRFPKSVDNLCTLLRDGRGSFRYWMSLAYSLLYQDS